MADIFISYVEEDGGIVREIAEGIEAAGYSVWYYERDGVVGASYLLQTRKAIDACQAFVLLISPKSVTSEQVTLEVVRAHETDKAFIPLRSNITHIEFAERQPEWSQAMGAATSTLIPPEGPSVTIPQVLRGLKKLNIAPRPAADSGQLPAAPLRKFEPATQEPAPAPLKTVDHLAKPKPTPDRPRKNIYLIAAAAVTALMVVIAVIIFWPDSKTAGEEPDSKTVGDEMITKEQFRDQFDDLESWTKPSSWSVDKGWLLINGSPELGYLSSHRYRDFTASFRLRIDGDDGAAWALRVNEKGYYLFALTGPTDTQFGQFVTYLYLADKDELQKVGTTYNLVRPLVVKGEYTITITVQKNVFIHKLKIESTPTGEWDGEEHKLAEYRDNTFPAGSIGFRAYIAERFAIGDLFVFPEGSDPLR